MRYTVLTYIFGGYERVHEIRRKDPEADYVLVTDDPTLKSETWRVIYDELLTGLTPIEKCYEVRFHPFTYVHTDIVVRLDGSIGINQSLSSLVDRFIEGRYDRCMMVHPYRNNMTDEYAAWVEVRGYSIKQAGRCLNIMEHLGYDVKKKGLFQSCFEIVRRNRVNYLINNMTHSLLEYAGGDHAERINQTWLSMVINHLFADRVKLMMVTEDILHGELMTWYQHNSDAVNPKPHNDR